VTSRPINARTLLPLPAPEQARVAAVLVLAVCLLAGGVWMLPPGLPARMLTVAGVTLVAVSLGMALRRLVARRGLDIANDMLEGFIENDAAASIVTDADGAILARNAAAEALFPETESETLAATLRGVLANPSSVLFRLQRHAEQNGAAHEDIVTRRGHVRLAVHRTGKQGFLWRVEDMSERPHAGASAATFPVPLISLGRSGTVLFMNEAARALAGQRVKSLDRLFPSLPLRPGKVNVMSTREGLRDVLVAEFSGSAGRRELFFLPSEGAGGETRASGFETLPVAMLKVGTDGRILAANRLAVDLLGGAPGENATLDSMMQGLGRPLMDWLRETAADRGAGQTSEFLRLTRKDKEIFVQVSLSRVVENGTSILIAVLNDATELKTLEAQFVQSQKMQAIGQLAGGIAHDFNNLLTAISGHCDLLLLRHDQGDQDFGDLEQIRQNANRAAALVGQLLAFSRKQTLRPEVLDLRDTLSDLTHLLNRLVGEKVTLTLSHDPVLRPIRADKRQLEQVLMNLVVNARDAMPQGGEIRIETEVVTLDGPMRRDRAMVPPGDYVTVKVRDEGVGIPGDDMPKVFEPFFTTKRPGEGTGLGLSTAYGIIKQTGGFIFVDSVEGSGTEFTLFFPAFNRSDAEMPAVAAPSGTASHQGDGVVLLVEDEAPVRAFAARALRLRGYTVLEAESAEDALQMLDDPLLRVDVFVTDVVMPGMDGPSWVRKAREQRPEVRVVFVSGYAEGAFGDAEPEVPNSVFLPKPFSLTQLAETVYEQMH